MLTLPANQILELPVDQLGLLVLRDMVETNAWNEHNYINEAHQRGGWKGEPLRALAEALGWLRARGLIAQDPDQGGNAIFVTRTGLRVAGEGPDAFYATERLQRGTLHPL